MRWHWPNLSPSAPPPIEYEIHQPDFVRGCWPQQRLSFAHRNLLSLTSLYPQPSLGVQAFDSLVVDDLACLVKLQVNYRRAIAPMTLGDRHDLLSQLYIVIALFARK